MGQKYSLLMNSRAAAGKDSGAPNPSPEDTCSSPPTILQPLPTEILLMISDFLPLSGIMALSYTCRALCNKMGVSIQNVLGEPISAPQIPTYAVKSSQERRPQPRASPPERGLSLKRVERLKLLCMLDLDGQLPQNKIICSSCATTHHRACFSEKSLQAENSHRQCLGSAGRVWICPHWIIDYSHARTHTQDSHSCGNNGFFMMTTWRGQIAPHYNWLVMPVIDGRLPSKQIVTDALRSLAVPVCPHWRFCDPFITDLYFAFADQGWVFRKYCQHCGTSVYFDIHRPDLRPRGLYLVVRRKSLEFKSRTDPAWIAQLHDPSEFPALEQVWQAATGGGRD